MLTSAILLHTFLPCTEFNALSNGDETNSCKFFVFEIWLFGNQSPDGPPIGPCDRKGLIRKMVSYKNITAILNLKTVKAEYRHYRNIDIIYKVTYFEIFKAFHIEMFV